MGKAVSLFCRSRGAIVGANLMKHQSGKETVRTDELGTCGIGCLARLLPCRNVRALRAKIAETTLLALITE
jgi:hypothetical protein